MIERLLPARVMSVAARGDGPAAPLFAEEEAAIASAVESRRREYASGRSCARLALGKLGFPPVPIPSGPGREPLWPPGVVGSITHCPGYRAAAVARQEDCLAVGIDAEIHDRLPEGVLELVAGHEERAFLAQAPGGVHWDRVLFSAKESIYKAWYPLTGEWLGFEEAAVSIEPRRGTFQARLLRAAPTVSGHQLTGFRGRFLIEAGLVLTAVAFSRQELAAMPRAET